MSGDDDFKELVWKDKKVRVTRDDFGVRPDLKQKQKDLEKVNAELQRRWRARGLIE